MPEERIFSEQEVTDIIRRAVEISERGSNPVYQPGVTRAELEHIAAEVGVSVEALHQAITEAGLRTDKRGWLHLTEEFERVVEGELDPDRFDLVVEDLKSFRNAGQPSMAQIGRKMTMSAWTGVGQAKVDVTSRNGRTTLKVKSNALLQALMTLHPGLIATMITVGAMSEQGLGLVGGAIGVGVMTLSTAAFAWLTKRGHRRAEEIADNLRERIAAEVKDQARQGSAEVEEPLHQRLQT